jgi:hypothetical protein
MDDARFHVIFYNHTQDDHTFEQINPGEVGCCAFLNNLDWDTTDEMYAIDTDGAYDTTYKYNQSSDSFEVVNNVPMEAYQILQLLRIGLFEKPCDLYST